MNNYKTPKRVGCENLDSAVGNTHYIAITITPSPYKKHEIPEVMPQAFTSYKTWDREHQKHIIFRALYALTSKYSVDIESHSYELTQKGSIHLHATLEVPNNCILSNMEKELIDILGYNGKNNKPSDTLVCIPIGNMNGWKKYQNKDKPKIDLMTIELDIQNNLE